MFVIIAKENGLATSEVMEKKEMIKNNFQIIGITS